MVGGGDGAVPAAANNQPDPDPRQAEDEALPVQPALPLLKLRSELQIRAANELSRIFTVVAEGPC